MESKVLEGYLWLPSSGDASDVSDDLSVYFKKYVLSDTLDEAWDVLSECRDSQYHDFKKDGPLMLCKVTLEELYTEPEDDGFVEPDDYDE